ncbi:MAG: tRNA (adenosine(37)-N6)-dimethylallyltransferase MiaA [Flavisolibacter sp.]
MILTTPAKTAIIIAGPTAVGKTSVAIEVAKHFQTEIISADSRQCFRELNIGVARPSAEELKQVPHHCIASHSVQEMITAADFEHYALAKVQELFQSHDVVVVTGGTGLYIKAFAEGLDAIPEVAENVRDSIKSDYEKQGLGWLQQAVAAEDPEFYQSGEIQNPQRLMRALEVVRTTGRSILHYRTQKKANRDFRIIKIALQLPKEELHQRISLRVDQMIEAGLEQEVVDLLPYRHLNALQTVGYREMFRYLDGEINLPEAIDEIKKNTRQYAKRQMTWFRKDQEYSWLTPSADAVLSFLDKPLSH